MIDNAVNALSQLNDPSSGYNDDQKRAEAQKIISSAKKQGIYMKPLIDRLKEKGIDTDKLGIVENKKISFYDYLIERTRKNA